MIEYLDVLDEFGNYTNITISRKECHEKGLWHKAVVVIILSKDNKKILLQQRSSNKKISPNLWDVAAGGHVLENELGYQAAIRETKEELGIDITKEELEFIGSTISNNIQDNIINRHFNEYYVVHKDVDIKDIILQKDEVQDVKWINKEEIIKRITNDYEELTRKVGCWNYLIKYYEITKKAK